MHVDLKYGASTFCNFLFITSLEFLLKFGIWTLLSIFYCYDGNY